MTRTQELPNLTLGLAQAVRKAALAAACPAAAFYLRAKDHFELASVFGAQAPEANADRGAAILAAAMRDPNGLMIVRDARREYGLHMHAPWLFAGSGTVGFMAAVHVAYRHIPV